MRIFIKPARKRQGVTPWVVFLRMSSDRNVGLLRAMASESGFTKPYCRSFTRSHSDAKFNARSKNFNTICMTGYMAITMSAHFKARCAVDALQCKDFLRERRRGTIKSPHWITNFDLTAVSIKSGNCQIKSRLLHIITHALAMRVNCGQSLVELWLFIGSDWLIQANNFHFENYLTPYTVSGCWSYYHVMHAR